MNPPLAEIGAAIADIDTPVIARADLGAGRDGPLIVEEYDATCLVPPGARAERDAAGNIVIELNPGG